MKVGGHPMTIAKNSRKQFTNPLLPGEKNGRKHVFTREEGFFGNKLCAGEGTWTSLVGESKAPKRRREKDNWKDRGRSMSQRKIEIEETGRERLVKRLPYISPAYRRGTGSNIKKKAPV